MTYISILITYSFVHLLSAASPGPNLLIVSRRYAASGSRKAGLLAVFGILCGTFIWSSATALGLGVLVSNYP